MKALKINMKTSLFIALICCLSLSFAQGDPCLNPDSNEARIFLHDTLELDSTFVCTDVIELSTQNVGSIIWSVYPVRSILSNTDEVAVTLTLDSSAMANRSARIVLNLVNECGSFRDTLVVQYMKPKLKFAEDTSIYRPSDIDLGADVNRSGIISTKAINTTEFLDNPETFITYADDVSHSISYIGSITTDSSQGGCIVVDTFNITFIDSVWGPYLPTAFTPNGDDKNDVFYVRIGGEFRVNLIIYDRWEKVIFTSTDKLDGWDGTYNGKDMGAGMYAYIVYGSYKDHTEFIKKGKVSLVR